MEIVSTPLLRAALAAAILAAPVHAVARDVVLFNGKDLTGWQINHVAFGPAAAPVRDDIWTVRDGAIYCSGGVGNNGWLHSLESFANFELHLEFRWDEIAPEVKAAGRNIYNSGLFLRSNPGVSGPGRASMGAMMAYQAQIIHSPARPPDDSGGTGDAWVSGYENPSFTGERPVSLRRMLGGASATAQDSQRSPGGTARAAPAGFGAPPPGTFASRMYQRSTFAEKPIGEWNSYDVTVNGDRLIYRLNGEVVNEVTGAMAVSGKIGLECENTPIFFRNIRLTTID